MISTSIDEDIRIEVLLWMYTNLYEVMEFRIESTHLSLSALCEWNMSHKKHSVYLPTCLHE
ncbi:hypothetical protein I7I53_01789 [Histoplasma capsulatum var. duboisii H88]|uniref:Uncharacterized protein n=1 Tax=Ajellomyces capsulatus (strain H88) TaxID=544711 RepID=A0A8A1LK16_AJEC8|nr:hypothetical protein I7I53_01789 [Histoplasma capsulatum var. duboisii H88]